MTDQLAAALERAEAAASGDWPESARAALFLESWLRYLQALSQQVQVVSADEPDQTHAPLKQQLEQITSDWNRANNRAVELGAKNERLHHRLHEAQHDRDELLRKFEQVSQELERAKDRERRTFDSLGHAKALISAIRHTVASAVAPSLATDVQRMIAEAERQGRF